MHLRTYLEQKKISVAEFAGLIHVSSAALHRYLGGERIPRPEVIARITDATDGLVLPNDFYPFMRAGEQGARA